MQTRVQFSLPPQGLSEKQRNHIIYLSTAASLLNPKRTSVLLFLKGLSLYFLQSFMGGGGKQRKQFQLKKGSGDFFHLHMSIHRYTWLHWGRWKANNVSGIIDAYPIIKPFDVWKVHSWSFCFIKFFHCDLQRLECTLTQYLKLVTDTPPPPPKPERISLSFIQLRHQRMQFWIASKEKKM